MKKIYFLMTALLLAFVGVTQTFAQDGDDLQVVTINNKTGGWTASGSPAYASEYATYGYKADEISVGVRIQHWNRSNGHNNNMTFVDGNLAIYSAFGSTVSEDYRIYPSKGYYVQEIRLDFIPYKHPNFAMNGVRVWANADEASAVTCPADYTEPAHYEMTGIPEAEYIPLTIGQLEEGGNPIFAIASNFTVTLAPRDPVEIVLAECSELYETYSSQLDSYVTGDAPGCYSEEAVSALDAALTNFYEHEMDPNITMEQAEGYKKAIEDAIEAVNASKITVYDVADGYYRIRTALTYSSGEKFMLGGKANATWGSIINTETGEVSTTDAAKALWKITKADEGYSLQNMYRDAYLGDANPAAMDAECKSQILIEPIITIEGITYSHLRTTNNAEADNRFFHQSGHSSGNGSAGNVVYWYSSYGFESTYTWGGSEWYLEPVTNEEAQEIIDAYATQKARELFIENFVLLRDEAKEALKNAKDIQEYSNLITDNSQFSSPWTEASEGSLDNLLDGNKSTYWHSAWSGGNVANHTHYLQVTLNEPVYDLVQMQISRRPVSNDHVTLWSVYGANDPGTDPVLWTEDDELPEGVSVGDVKEEGTEGDWVELASLATPFGNNTETLVSEEFDTKGYKYLRFYIDGTTTGRGYGHVSEFQIVIPVVNPNSQYAYMGEVATTLEAVLRRLADTADEDLTQEQFDELVSAYDAFKAQYVDPAELRTLLTKVEAIANGVKEGTQPGYWKSASVGNELKATYDQAKAYDEAGVYAKARSDEFIAQLNAQVQAVMDAVIGIQEGKWYRIHFGSRDEFEAQGWDVETNDATVSNDIETNEALWDKYVTVAALQTEDNTVTVTNAETGETSEATVTVNKVVPVDAESVRRHALLYLDADEDIEQKDLSLFRFVGVGDTAYVLQNKATGLFVNAASTTLDIIPSLFRVKAIGYGQNLIAAQNLITSATQNNLHAQRAQNRLVTYGENTPGSRSGLYIEEAGDVDAAYAGTAYADTVHIGELYANCYPVSLAADENENEGVMYTVNAVEVGNEQIQLSLAPMTKAAAGRPFIYIYGNPDNYNKDLAAKEVIFHHGYEFVKEPANGGFLKGSFTQEEINGGYIVTGGNLIDYLGKFATDQERNQFYITQDAIIDHVVAFGAYMTTEDGGKVENPGLDIVFELTEDEDHIAEALSNVARSGAIYTLDGRLVSRNGNLNTLRSLGKGVYILNGTKVAVK